MTDGTRRIKPPFFELGPKAYLYGDSLLALAKHADYASKKYDVDIIITPQHADIRLLAGVLERVFVFAQHMDPIPVGPGIGTMLPEAIKSAGAQGVFLNHAEKRMTLSDICRAISRAKEVGLISMVCADTPDEAVAIAHFAPDILVAEAPELIGTGKRNPEDMTVIQQINTMVGRINPNIRILHGAGISDEKDVAAVIAAGAEATGSTSGVIKAKDPFAMLENMIASVRAEWDKRNQKK